MTVHDTHAVVTAYRHLYRAGLRAVQYSSPARYTLRRTLRKAFRDGSTLNPQRLQNTLQFLENAARCTGIEHKVVKNLLMVKWWRTRLLSEHMSINDTIQARNKAKTNLKMRSYRDFDDTVKALNKTLNIDLR